MTQNEHRANTFRACLLTRVCLNNTKFIQLILKMLIQFCSLTVSSENEDWPWKQKSTTISFSNTGAVCLDRRWLSSPSITWQWTNSEDPHNEKRSKSFSDLSPRWNKCPPANSLYRDRMDFVFIITRSSTSLARRSFFFVQNKLIRETITSNLQCQIK